MEQPIERQTATTSQSRTFDRASLPGQVVLVLQGGGALGSYEAGVYQARRCKKRVSSRTGSSGRLSERSTPA
jgi:hypothetical protein